MINHSIRKFLFSELQSLRSRDLLKLKNPSMNRKSILNSSLWLGVSIYFMVLLNYEDLQVLCYGPIQRLRILNYEDEEQDLKKKNTGILFVNILLS